MTYRMPEVSLIAAACESLGIGYRGDLPWKLKNEMAYFNRMTTNTKNPDKQNAVIMGRKTWFSIPPKRRPLPRRINVVISREMKEIPEGADYLAHSIDEAVRLLTTSPKADKIERLWVIGGSGIYKAAIESLMCHRIYLTRIMAKFDCDTFFPEISTDKFLLVTDPDVSDEIQEESGIKYKFEVYERKIQPVMA